MKAIKSALRSMLPRSVRLSRARDKARRENDRLLSMDVSLSEEHIGRTRILADRLSLLSHLPSGGVAAEVGVADGLFSEKILEFNKPAKLHLIDLWGMRNHPAYGEAGLEKVRLRLRTALENNTVTIHRGISWEMLEILPDKALDWIYIDASHDYDNVRKDLEIAQRKVKESGFIAGHDYIRWGRFGARFGVLEAVNEFCITHEYEIAFLTLESNYNWSYALKKIDFPGQENKE